MNLFQKYGGADFWSDFLNIFYTRVTSSPLLSRFFVDKDVDNIKTMLIGLLEITLVTEGHYPEDVLKEGHKYMEITNEEMDEWVRIYTGVLRESGIEEEDQKTVLAVVGSYLPSIVSKP